MAAAETDISVSPSQVWAALTDPVQVQEFMLGAQVETDWRPGSPIRWRGEYDGRPYEDKGEIVAADTPHRLEVTHFRR